MIDLLRDFGFPVFVCLWFMFRTEKIITGNTQALLNIKKIISNCHDKGRR